MSAQRLMLLSVEAVNSGWRNFSGCGDEKQRETKGRNALTAKIR